MPDKQRHGQINRDGIQSTPLASVTVQDLLSKGRQHHGAGRLDAAEQVYRSILATQPRHAESLYLLGGIAFQTGRTDEAVAHIGQAISLDGQVAPYHSALGAALKELGRLDEAEAACQKAVALAPDFAQAHFNLANALKAQGRLGEAETAYRRAIELWPGYAKAHANLGNLLGELSRDPEAEVAYRRAIALMPDYAEAHSNLALNLYSQRRSDEAEASCRTALRLNPNSAQARCNLGLALHDQGRLDAAEASYRQAITLKPDYAEAYSNLAITHQSQDLPDLAEAALRTAIKLKPDSADSHFNLAVLLLRGGRFAEGWSEYEWRWRRKDVIGKVRDVTIAPWGGEPSSGGTILLWAEQGLGDTLQFIRFLPAVMQAGWRIVLEVPKPLHCLFKTLENITLISTGDPVPPFDVQCPLLSLPRLLGTGVESIPADIPYIQAEAERVAAWGDRLPAQGWRIGIAWQGNPTTRLDMGRSFPLAAMAPLAKIPGVRLISLQKSFGTEQLAALPAGMVVETLGPAYDDGQDAFLDTAAVMMNLDLVIACDTSVAHLAGALGRPVWLAVKRASEWRWLTDREDSPWYPTMRVFRQDEAGDWDGLFARIASAAEALVAKGRGRRLKASKQPKKTAKAELAGQDMFAAALQSHRAGRFDDAEQLCQRILADEPRHAESLHLLGVMAYQAKRSAFAVEQIKKAIAINARAAPFHSNLAAALTEQGQLGEAEAACRKALVLWPDFPEGYFNLGNALKGLGRLDEAVQAYRRAVELRPDYAKATVSLGHVLKQLGRLSEAAIAWRHAAVLKPDDALLHNLLGIVLYEHGQVDEAIECCGRAVALVDDFPDARRNLSKLLFERGDVVAAQECLQRGLELRPGDLATAILSALRFSNFPMAEEIPPIRARIAETVNAIGPGQPPLGGPMEIAVTNFYLAYHGSDDQLLQSAIASMHRRVFPSLEQGLRPCGQVGDRIRVGFISAHLTSHTIGMLNVGLIEKLDPKSFEVIVLRTQTGSGSIVERIGKAAAKVVVLPGDLEGARQAVAAEQLDILYYTDIGMDPFTYYLAFSRLAPVQAVTWGHPVTTGLDSIDYFLSAAPMEPADAVSHYTENLILFDRLNVYYQPLSTPAKLTTRAELGLPETGTLYGCPQSLFKFHPDFDGILAEIADGDPSGHIVLLEGSSPSWSAQLRARWAKTAPSLGNRAVFLPRLAHADFMALQSLVDVLLDPVHFGGGNTVYEAMVWGTPVVTWPGEFLRGRIADGMYQQMGVIDAPVAQRLEDYAPLALALGRDPERCRALRQSLQKAARQELFADMRAVYEMEAFFSAAIVASRKGEVLPSGWLPEMAVA